MITSISRRRALKVIAAGGACLASNFSMGLASSNTPRALHCMPPQFMLDRLRRSGSQANRTYAEQALSTNIVDYSTSPANGHKNERLIFSAQHGKRLPGILVRREGDPSSGDIIVDETYEAMGILLEFLRKLFDRRSLDGLGINLHATVHYDIAFQNALWTGTQAVFGCDHGQSFPGDRIFNRFSSYLDVIAHEFFHGFLQYEPTLLYLHQPGAMNESLADVFGMLVKQWHLGQAVEEADWLIGAGVIRLNGQALRSFRLPGTAFKHPELGNDPQRAHMSEFLRAPIWGDNGGVHVNSGIPNHAFYVAARELGGFAWERAGRIWFYAARDKLRRVSNFQESAHKIYDTARELYGDGSREARAVAIGWEAVGIDCTRKEGPLDIF